MPPFCTIALLRLPLASPHVLQFSPDISILVLTFGLLLIFFELNRPGLIVAGALGLTGVLLALGSWRQWHLSTLALALLLSGMVPPLWQLRHSLWPRWTLASDLASALAFSFGFLRLVAGPAPAHVHQLVAVGCGLILGAGTSLLARIACSARRNKGLN